MHRDDLSMPRVPFADRWIGAAFARMPGLLRRLAALETRTAADAIGEVRIDRPVYVCGLARSGSTLLLEVLAAHPQFTSHRYSDYPAIWFPWWWNALRGRLPLPSVPPRERAHRDRIEVTPDSPEAFEEIFWMHFFADRHRAEVDQTLDGRERNAAFDAFLRDHVRKLLAVRGAKRYVAKANYHGARLGYLRALFPDARFVVPVRDPLTHVASLVKQDRLFCAAARENPSIATHLARVGHFEFGPHRRVQNLDDAEAAQRIAHWHATGCSAQAYALQWAQVYGHLLDHLDRDRALAEATLLVRHESLCAEPAPMLAQVFRHVEADDAEALVARFAPRIGLPTYYETGFDDEQTAAIDALTRPVAERLAALC